MKKEDLDDILESHAKWLDVDQTGVRADLSSADLRYANLSYANLRSADLRYANLSYANLRSADLRYADLRSATGNMKELRSIFAEKYPITYTFEIMQIGCEKHKITDWWDFDEKIIAEMDGTGALHFWRKWKPILQQIIEAAPAIKPELEEQSQ